MPIPTQSARVALIGSRTDGEIFETGFWLNGVIADNAEANAAAAVIAAAFTTAGVDDAVAPLIDNTTHYDEVRVYGYPTGGPSSPAIGSAALAVTGTGSSSGLPLQTCAVLTLRTGFAGRSFRGRMYLPALGTTLATGHLLNTGQVTACCNAFADLFTLLNTTAGIVSVVSQTLGVKTPVTEVTVDNRPDIQRRRANQQPSVTVATATVTVP